MNVIHCPVIIANNSVVISKYLRRLGVDSKVISYFRTWLKYEGDINLDLDNLDAEQRQKKLRTFVDDFLSNEANKYDIFHFHFFDTLSTGSSFGGWRSHGEKSDFWDLKVLKDMRKKIVVTGVGSELRNNSKITYYQLKYLFPGLNLPYPPLNRRDQYGKIWQIAQYADAIVCADSETMKHAPYSTMILHPIDLEPLEQYRRNPNTGETPSILHAPTNNVSKGTEYIIRILNRIRERYGDAVELRLIQGVPHHDALKLYPGPGLAIDQINMSFGLFATEAMYLGRPVICSLRREEFMPCDPKASAPMISVSNEENFYQSIIDYLEGNTKVSTEELTAYVVEHHAAEKVAAEYKDLYESLLDGQPLAHHVSNRWFQEFNRLICNQSPDQAGYYSTISDILLAIHDLQRLQHEAFMGKGIGNDTELLAKLVAAYEATGNKSTADQLNNSNLKHVVSKEYKSHLARAKTIWKTRQIPRSH